jgi:hypothetical protein
VAEFIEGKPAAAKFVGAMRQILSGHKPISQQAIGGLQKRHKLGR